MSTLVGRIKGKVSRRKASRDMPDAFDTFTTVTTTTTVTTSDGETGVVTYRPFTPTGPTRISLENSAFHVSRGTRRPTSWENASRGSTALPDPTYKTGGPHKRIVSLDENKVKMGETIPPRSSSKRDLDDRSSFVPVTRTGQGSEQRNTRYTIPSSASPPRSNRPENLEVQEDIVEEMIPQRASSKHAVPVPHVPAIPTPLQTSQAPTRAIPSNSINDAEPATDTSPARTYSRYHLDSGLFSKPTPSKARRSDEIIIPDDGTPGPSRSSQRLPRSVQNSNRQPVSQEPRTGREPSGNLPGQAATSKLQQPDEDINRSAKSNESRPRRSSIIRKPLPTTAGAPVDAGAVKADHLRLPPGFSLQNTEQTHISEDWRPAVTHETIIKQKTEVLQEEITRDVHVHHYYTYLQPIKVVEVLPAKHFFLDLETGVKTEIPQPQGWTMPVSMIPNSPDTSMVKAWTRHYLVNEEHPNGIIEPPPLKHEYGYQNLRQEAKDEQR